MATRAHPGGRHARGGQAIRSRMPEEDRLNIARPTLPLAAVLAALSTTALPVRAGNPPYAITARMPVGGEGGWDCLRVDSAAHRLYVTRSSHVQVIDTRSDSLVGDLPETPGVHDVAIVPELGRGFTSNGRDSSVTVFDLQSLARIATVKIPGRNPDILLYDGATKRVFAFNGGSSNAVAIDTGSNQVAGAIALDGRPEFAVSDGHGRIFVNLEDSSAVECFDARSLSRVARWPLAPGEEPTGLAIDLEHHRLFAGCGNQQIVVLDSETGRVVTTRPIGERCDGVAFDPALGRILTTNGDGTLSVIHEDSPDRYTKVADVPTQRGARTIAVDATNHRVYTCTAKFGETPAPTAERPHPRPSMIPGSFVILELTESTGPGERH